MSPVDLHHVLDGPPDGPPVLLSGSIGSNLSMWEPQVDGLADSGRVLRVDHRGHGGSPVPDGPYSIEQLGADVLGVMDRLGLERTAYCGLSLGGMVGQWLAINAPQRITALVLLCTYSDIPSPQPWHERAATVRAAGTPEVVAEATMTRWFTEPWRAAHPDRVAAFHAMVSSTPAEGYAGCCEAIAGLDLTSGLSGVTAPTLVIGGAQDPSIPVEQTRALGAAIPGARVEILDPGAHLASAERADAVTKLIIDHLTRNGEAG
jgi:3-oxoadipate enol-lactonase